MNNFKLVPCRKRGSFVIFNHTKFDKDSKYHSRPRRGSNEDVKRLRKLFKELGFDVFVYQDKTKQETLEILDKYNVARMRNCEMFAMAILTHGEDHGRLFTFDHELHLNDYIKPIKMNDTLVG